MIHVYGRNSVNCIGLWQGKNDKIALKELFSKDERFQSIDEDTLRVISVATDEPSLWNNRKKAQKGNGGYATCKAMDEIEAEAKTERDVEKITDMLKRGKTVEQIVDFCNYPYEQVQNIAKSMSRV